MATTQITLPIPASNGVGAAVDTHLLDVQKSFVLDGTLGRGEILLVEGTEDPAGLIGFTGITAWNNSNPGDMTLDVVCAFMRIRRSFALPGSVPTASVSATSSGTNTYFNLPVPALSSGLSGVGASVDVSAGGQAASLTVHEGIGFGFNEELVLQGSNDNVSFVNLVAWTMKTKPGFYPFSYKFLRIFRQNASAAVMSVFLGTATSGAGGGAFPGFGAAPPAVAAASAPGSTGLASDAGHTHLGVRSVTPGANMSSSGTATDPILNATSPTIISGLDVSAMTGGVGSVGWVSFPGFAEPTDSLAPNSSHSIGVLIAGGALVTAGLVTAKFTIAGGKPANGAPVYVASAKDDALTGAGKLTATRPSASCLGDVQNFAGTFSQCIVRVGTVLDNSNYDSAQTCIVDFTGWTGSLQGPPSDTQFVGAQLGPFTTTNYLSAPFDALGATLHDGESIVVGFTINATWDGNGVVVSNFDGTNGWSLRGAGNMFFNQVAAGVVTSLDLGSIRAGLNVAVLSVHDGKMWGSLNNNPPASVAVVVTDAGSGTLRIGGWAAGGSPLNAWKNGGVAFINKYARPFLLPEMSRLPIDQVFPKPPKNRFILPDIYDNDGSLIWKWQPSYGGIAYTVYNAVAIVFTVVGAPVTTELAEGWFRSLAPYFLDTEPTYYDSNGIPRPSASARLSFTTPLLNQDICVGIWGLDHLNSDQEAIGLSIDGVFQGPVLPSFVSTPAGQLPDNRIHYFWIPVTAPGVAAATHDIKIVNSGTAQMSGSMSGVGAYVVEVVAGQQQIFDSPVIGKRMLFVGYDNASGQDSVAGFNPQNAAVTLIRADFPTAGGPGGVTSESSVGRRIYDMYTAGGNSMLPFAHKIVTEGLAAGGAGTVIVYISLVFKDYADPIVGWRPTNLAAQAGALVDFIHALQPTWIVFYQKATEVQFDAIANINGDTLAQFNTAVDGLTAGRGWLGIINARVPGAIGFQGAAPQYIMSVAGIVTYKGNIKTALGIVY